MKERKKLIKLRTSMGLKQKDVAESINITTSYYGMIEQGKRMPNLSIALSIAKFFNTPVEEIFFEDRNN